VQALAQVDLQMARAPTVRSILILDNDKLPSAARWADSLAGSGIALEYRTLPGLIEMAMTAPQFATVPRVMIDATRRWLSSTVKTVEIDRPPTYRDPPAAVLPLIADQDTPATTITERPVCI